MPAEQALRYDRLAAAAGGLGESHRWLIERVPVGAVVLDCGCAGGFLARALVERGACTVDGIEIDAAAAQHAAVACRRVLTGSLEDPDFLDSLSGGYDRIVCGDVLEHLRDPEAALRVLGSKLRPGGRILVAVPNVAHWRTRLGLLRGRFDYGDAGILDRTHLRFYTYHGARAMAERAGLRVIVQGLTLALPPEVTAERLLRRLMTRWPNLFAYQTLLELEPCPA